MINKSSGIVAIAAVAFAFAQGAKANDATIGTIGLRSRFSCCGVEFKSTNRIDGLRLEWRTSGDDAWKSVDAIEFPYFPQDGAYRGSIRGLFEDTEYSARIATNGGQRNVRCHGNRFESALCGVSVQGCMMGPSYVYDNLFSGMCGEFGEAGQTLKTGGGKHGPDAVVFADGNTFWGKGGGVTMMDTLRAVLRGNVFCGGQAIRNQERSPSSIAKGNRFGAEIPERDLDPSYPRRPTPFTLDCARFSGIIVTNGNAEPESVRVMVRGGAEPSGFEIAKGDDFDWFDVEPSHGTVPANGELELNVKFRPEKMRDRRHYRGVFLVRTKEGLSRPVTLYAETDFVPPYKAGKEGDVAIYHPDFREGEWKPLCNGDECGEFAFDVPEDGRYYFMVRSKGWLKLKVAVDDDVPAVSRQQNAGHPTWTMLAPGKVFGDMCRFYDLKKGRHVVRIWKEAGDPVAEGLVLTDNPHAFEPR